MLQQKISERSCCKVGNHLRRSALADIPAAATEEVANQSIQQLMLTVTKKHVLEKDMRIGLCGKGGIRSDHLVS